MMNVDGYDDEESGEDILFMALRFVARLMMAGVAMFAAAFILTGSVPSLLAALLVGNAWARL